MSQIAPTLRGQREAGVALHEAVVGDTPVELSLAGQLRGLPPMPSPAGSPGQPQRLRLASPVNFVAWGCC